MEAHRMARDGLSRRLWTWGAEVLQLLSDEPPNMQILLARKINELQRKILINPIDRAPLKDVILQRGRIWEEWMLRLYQQLDEEGYSPFDGQYIETDHQVHSFGNHMVAWLGDVLRPTDDPDLTLLSQEVETIEIEREEQIQTLKEEMRVEQDKDIKNTLGIKKYALGGLKKNYVLKDHAAQADPHKVLSDYDNIAKYVIKIEKDEEALSDAEKLEHKLFQETRLTEEAIEGTLSALREGLAESERNNKANLNAMKESYEGQIQAQDEVIDRAHGVIQGLHGRVVAVEGNVHTLEARVAAISVQLQGPKPGTKKRWYDRVKK